MSSLKENNCYIEPLFAVYFLKIPNLKFYAKNMIFFLIKKNIFTHNIAITHSPQFCSLRTNDIKIFLRSV